MGSLSDENQALRQELEQVTEQRDSCIEMITRLKTLAEGQSQRLREMQAELERLRSQPTTPEPGTLPDAGELLQKIRVKFPKLKVALKEVEAVLETLQEP